MELEVWNGDWGLPTIDVKCLELLAYAKFSGAPIKLVKTNNPWKSPSGSLPVLRHNKKYIGSSITEVKSFLQKQNYNADFSLTPQQTSDVVAYKRHLDEKLGPALEYIWWRDAKNYVELTRPWYAKALPFPLNFWVPGQMQRQVEEHVEARFSSCDTLSEQQIETALYKDAEECITMLSHRLAESEFFFGKSPSSLDAAVFGHLAPLMKAPFPHPSLQNHLKACDNLVRFVARVLNRYFQTSTSDHGTQNQHESVNGNNNSSRSNGAGDEEFPHKRRNQILSGLFASAAMIGYALLSGMVQVDIMDERDEEHSSTDPDNITEFFEDKEEKRG
jgi:metaxin